MICITDQQKQEVLTYFRENMPEFAKITDNTFMRVLNRSCLYIPEFIQTHLHRKYPCCEHSWVILREILALWVSHVIMLSDLLAQAEGEEVLPAELQRTAQSLSEGGLSVSYAQAVPAGETPQALYDYLTRTAYGDQAKILIEQCLTGARGVFIV